MREDARHATQLYDNDVATKGCGYAFSRRTKDTDRRPALAHAIETELCRVTDHVNAQGMADHSFAGKALGNQMELRISNSNA